MRETQEYYRDLVENSLDLMCTHDLNGVLLTVNVAAARTLGYEPAELLNRNLREFLSPKVYEEFDGYLVKLRQNGSSTGFMRLRTKSGETRIWKYSNTVRTKGVTVPVVRGIAHDFTDILQAQKALREGEERIRRIVQKSPVAMLVTHGVEQKNELINDKFTALFGYSIEDVPCIDHWWPLAYPDENYREEIRAEWQSRVTEAIRNHSEIAPMEAKVCCKDGSCRYVEFHFASLGETNLVSFVDLTARKNAEEVLSSVSRRLIEAQERERARIARELHDDLSQRMALLSISLEQFKRGMPDLPPEARKQLRRIEKTAMDVSSDIHNLSHQLHPAKLDTLGLVAALGGLCRELSSQHNLQVEFVHRDIPGGISKDVTLCLFRIAQEALRNVVKHSGAAEAKVALSGHDDRIDLCISDSGAGFSPESANGVAGLGLISMRERLRLVGGRLSVESEPSHGTQILVSIPLPATSAPVDDRAHHGSNVTIR